MGLIQREIESRNIRTAAMIHLPNLFEKSRPPRALITKRKLGKTFSQKAEDLEAQKNCLMALLYLAFSGGPEEFKVYND